MRLRFDDFSIDPANFRLCRGEHVIPVERRVFDVLRYLVTHPNQAVTKEELIQEVWSATVLTDSVITNTIAKLRRALGQAPSAKYPIETIHGRGYRWCAVTQQEQATATAPGAVRSQTRDFVGRNALLSAIGARMQHAGTTLTLVLGDTGMGKTHLARELAHAARQQGRRIFWGTAHEGAQPLAFWPWVQLLHEAHARLTDQERAASWPRDPLFAQQFSPDGPAASALDIEPLPARFRLFDSVCAFLSAVSAERGLLLVLDDLHLADAATLELLAHVARALPLAPISLLALAREIDVDHRVTSEARAWERIRQTATVHRLEGLTPGEVAELSRLLRGSELDPELSVLLHRRTQGNPLFVKHALDLLATEVAGRPDINPSERFELQVPSALLHAIQQRLARLPNATQQLLAAASVLGPTFDSRVLAEVADLPLSSVLNALDHAIKGQILEPPLQTTYQTSFSHAVVRDVLYQESTVAQRGTWHRLAAHCFERRARHPRAAEWGTAAYHFLRATPVDIPAAAEAFRLAAATAVDASDLDGAAGLLKRGLEKVGHAAEFIRQRARLLIDLGIAQFSAGSLVSAWRSFREAALLVPQSDVALRTELAPYLADCVEVGVGEVVFARHFVESVLGERSTLSTVTQASLLAQLAELSIHLVGHERLKLLDRADALAQTSADAQAILEVAQSKAILRDPSLLNENERDAARFLELTEVYPDAATKMRSRSMRYFGAHMTLYLCSLIRGDLERADTELEICADISHASHSRVARMGVALFRCGRALGDGNLALLEELLDRRSAPDGEELPSQLAFAYYRAMLALARNDRDGLLRLPRPVAPDTRYALHGTAVQAYVMAAHGERRNALALLGHFNGARIERMPMQVGELGVLCYLADACHQTGHIDLMPVLHARLLPYLDRNAVGPAFGYLGSVGHYLGLLSVSLGDPCAARAQFELAVQVNDRLGMQQASARSRDALSRLSA